MANVDVPQSSEVCFRKRQTEKFKSDIEDVYYPDKGVDSALQKPKDGKKVKSRPAVGRSNGDTEKRLYCSQCDKTYKSMSSYRVHKAKHDGKRFFCEDCGKLYSALSSLTEHQHVHQNLRPYECTKCGKIFRTRSHCLRHEKNHKDYDSEEKTSDNILSDSESTGSGLQTTKHSHKKLRTSVKKNVRLTEKLKKSMNEQAFVCKICRRIYKNKSSLQVHEKKHRGIKYPCPLCFKNFTTKYQMMSHKITHTRERYYRCDTCGFEFMRKAHLARHMKLHAGIKRYVCYKCGKAFVLNESLVAHMKVHDLTSTLPCEVCCATFKSRSALSVHMKLHTNQKDFTCDICGRAFLRKRTLEGHLKIHERGSSRQALLSAPTVFCQLCSKGFYNDYGLKRHMRKHKLGLLKNFNKTASKTDAEKDTPCNLGQSKVHHQSSSTGTSIQDISQHCSNTENLHMKLYTGCFIDGDNNTKNEKSDNLSKCFLNGKSIKSCTEGGNSDAIDISRKKISQNSENILIDNSDTRLKVVKIKVTHPSASMSCEEDKKDTFKIGDHEENDHTLMDDFSSCEQLETDYSNTYNQVKEFDQTVANDLKNAEAFVSDGLQNEKKKNDYTSQQLSIDHKEMQIGTAEASGIIHNDDAKNDCFNHHSQADEGKTSGLHDSQEKEKCHSNDRNDMEDQDIHVYDASDNDGGEYLEDSLDIGVHDVKGVLVEDFTRGEVSNCHHYHTEDIKGGEVSDDGNKNAGDISGQKITNIKGTSENPVVTEKYIVTDSFAKCLETCKGRDKCKNDIVDFGNIKQIGDADVCSTVHENAFRMHSQQSDTNCAVVYGIKTKFDSLSASSTFEEVCRQGRRENATENSESEVDILIETSKHRYGTDERVDDRNNCVEDRLDCEEGRHDKSNISSNINQTKTNKFQRKFKCMKCYKSFYLMSTLKHHMATHGEGNKTHSGYSCSECFQNFISKRQLFSHVRLFHRNSKLQSDSDTEKSKRNSDLSRHQEKIDSFPGEQTTDNFEVKCCYCGKEFTSLEGLGKHMQYHREKKLFTCNQCRATFTSSEKLQYHINSLHEMEGNSQFKKNNVSVDTKDNHNAREQKVNHHSDGKPQDWPSCEKCGKGFKLASKLIVHKKLNICELRHKCEKCKQKFGNTQLLKAHLYEVHNVSQKQFSCSLCAKAFENKRNLTRHKLIYHSDSNGIRKDFMCSKCGKCFARSDTLKVHMNSHLGLQLYQCDQCPSKFGQSGHLRRHIKACHEGTLDYVCGIKNCVKRFSSADSVRAHQRSHRNELLHECVQCFKKFKYASSLKTHMKTHFENKEFVCHICSQELTTKHSLEKHLERHTAVAKMDPASDIYDPSFRVNLRQKVVKKMEDKKFSCQYCQKKFTTKRGTYAHQRKFCKNAR